MERLVEIDRVKVAMRMQLPGFYEKNPEKILPTVVDNIADLRTFFPSVEISESIAIGLREKQFRGLTSPKFEALSVVIGKSEAERMVDYALLLGLSSDWYRIGKPAVPLTQGRGLMQLGADFIATLYAPFDDLDLNTRLYLSAKKSVGTKDLLANDQIDINFSFVEKPKKPKLIATYPTNYAGQMLDFIAAGCSQNELLLQAQKTLEDLSNRPFSNSNERKVELASVLLIIAHHTNNFSSVRTQLDVLMKINNSLNLQDEKEQKIALAIKKQIKRYAEDLKKVGGVPKHIAQYLKSFDQKNDDED